MTTTEQLLHRWFDEVWNHPRAGAVDELFAENGCMFGVSRDCVEGRDGFRELRGFFQQAFSDIHVDITETAESDRGIFARLTLSMTHRATGKQVSVPAAGWGRFENGQLVEAHNFFDMLAILEQIGAAPEGALEAGLAGTQLMFRAMEA